jgi:hypothetical protein
MTRQHEHIAQVCRTHPEVAGQGQVPTAGRRVGADLTNRSASGLAVFETEWVGEDDADGESEESDRADELHCGIMGLGGCGVVRICVCVYETVL